MKKLIVTCSALVVACLLLLLIWKQVQHPQESDASSFIQTTEIDKIPVRDLIKSGLMAHSSAVDFFVLISNDGSAVMPIINKDIFPKNNTPFRVYGQYIGMPNFAYQNEETNFAFSKVRFLQTFLDAKKEVWSFFVLSDTTRKAEVGVAINLTKDSINFRWFSPEELKKSLKGKNIEGVLANANKD